MVTQKRELENNQTIYETCLKGFSFLCQKNKGKIFFDGKSRSTLLAGATLNNRVYLSEAMFFYKCALKSPGKFGQNTTELAILNLKKKGLWAFFVRFAFLLSFTNILFSFDAAYYY